MASLIAAAEFLCAQRTRGDAFALDFMDLHRSSTTVLEDQVLALGLTIIEPSPTRTLPDPP